MRIGFVIRDQRGYISLHDYKINREALNRARFWKSLANVERYLQTDSFRRLAKHATSDLTIEQAVEGEDASLAVTGVIRTIPLAEIQAAAQLASTRAERRARGLKN